MRFRLPENKVRFATYAVENAYLASEFSTAYRFATYAVENDKTRGRVNVRFRFATYAVENRMNCNGKS